jgi:hypothetical protein
MDAEYAIDNMTKQIVSALDRLTAAVERLAPPEPPKRCVEIHNPPKSWTPGQPMTEEEKQSIMDWLADKPAPARTCGECAEWPNVVDYDDADGTASCDRAPAYRIYRSATALKCFKPKEKP